MEVENLCSSLSDSVEAELHQSQQDSRTSADQQRINGEQVVSIVWREMEMQINQTDETTDVSLSPKSGRRTPEEAGQREEMLWTPHPIACTSSAFSVATVKWDMPDSSTESPVVVTDSSLANELHLGSISSTSPTIHQPQDVNDGDFEQEDKEEQDEGELLNSATNCSGNISEPCDAADVKEPETQIKEDSAHELLERTDDLLEAVPRTDLEEDGEHAVTSAAVETEDLVDIIEDIPNSEDAFLELKVEEEEEARVLLTEREDSEGEESSESCVENEVREQQGSPVFSEEGQTLVEDVETEEENGGKNEPGEQQSVTDVYIEEENEEPEAVSSLRDQQATAETLQTDNIGTNASTDNLTGLQEPELLEDIVHSEVEEDTEIPERLHEELTVQHEKLEICADADQNVDPEQSVVSDVDEEAPIQDAESTEKIGSSPETVEVIVNQEETRQECDRLQPEDSDQSGQSRDLDQPPEMELMDQRPQSENTEQPEDPTQSEQTACIEAEIPEQRGQMGPSEPQTTDSPQSKQAEDVGPTDVHRAVGNGAEHKAPDLAAPYMNGDQVDREKACRLAERLFKLENVERADVVKHVDKDNDFSRAVGEEYLKFFDFTGQTLDQALRSFLRVVVLIGETQERERVLQHFSNRFHQCNPDSYSSPGAVLTLTCALMLLNTDLHGQHVGKSMSSSKFVSNLDGMNEGENFNKDLLKSLYSSIKSEPLQWAVDEEELKNLVEESAGDDTPLRSKANPFQDVPHDKKASVVKEGFLQRKLHADINGKRTPWGKRGWKTFFGVLKGMVLYLQKSDYRREQMTSEEVVSVHHSLAERAAEYTKKPNVFRLQTADGRVFLFQASSKVEMNSWISRVNLVSALHSSPPFPAAVGSQRKFLRPILPASRSAYPLERQLQFHKQMLESFKDDLLNQEQNVPDAKKVKTRDLEEHRNRAEYLHHEVCRYESYIQVLESWKSMKTTDGPRLSASDLSLFDRAACQDSGEEEKEEEGGLKRSHSSPSLELEIAAPVIKVKRNISERRTYRKPIVPRWNKEA